MEIRKLFGQQSAEHAQARHQRGIEGQAEQNLSLVDGSQSQEGQDVISLSSLSRQLSQVSGILDEDSQKRAARVQSLKESVADGSYSVSSTDVAGSLISYASDVSAAQ